MLEAGRGLAHSTMTLQHDGRIGFFLEQAPTDYSLFYQPLTLESITGGAFRVRLCPAPACAAPPRHGLQASLPRLPESIMLPRPEASTYNPKSKPSSRVPGRLPRACPIVHVRSRRMRSATH